MAWTYNISTYFGAANAEVQTVFGQLTFSGNYSGNGAGGDPNGTFVMGGNTLNMPQYLQASSPHFSRAPLIYNIQIDAGFFAFVTYTASTGATNFRIKVVNSTTGAELANGAYPAGLTAAGLSNTMMLNYKLSL